MKWIIALMMCLLLVAACGPKPVVTEPEPTTPAEPTVTPPETVVAPPTAVVTEPEPPARVMDADTQSRLTTNFKPGVRFALSHPTYKMKIGESKVFGIGLRALLPATDTYQVNWRLVRSYDKSKSPITSDTPDIQGWIESNGVSASENYFAPVELATNGEIKYPFLVTVQKTFASGLPTKPGTYVIEFLVKAKGRASVPTNQYTTTEMTLIVE